MTSKNSDRLIEIFSTLDVVGRQSLMSYAEYLSTESPGVNVLSMEPIAMSRPDTETVVGALNRLKQTYPMIESMVVFSEASSLMTDHMIHGRDATEVIDDMETLFEKTFRQLVNMPDD